MSSDDKTQISPLEGGVPLGTQLNGIYELDERVAFGGMGEVYRGHNIHNDEPVAIKIVLPELARDDTILSLFKKESNVLSRLAHDAIVRYHTFMIDSGTGRPCLVMEFVEGESLADELQKAPMEPERVRRLLMRLASGLQTAHSAGVIHRDLSPDNVILPGDDVDRAKIIDFGIAKSAGIGGGTLLGGKFAGKYNFVSPEQLGLHKGEITGRSDIYSLGLVAAAALRGEPLDMAGSQVDVIEKRQSVPDLSSIDETMRPVVEAMLQSDPDHRPQSMEDIVKWLAGLDVTGPANAPGTTNIGSAIQPPLSVPPVSSIPPSPTTAVSTPPVSTPPASAAPTPPDPVMPSSMPPPPVSVPPDGTVISTGVSYPPGAAVSQPPQTSQVPAAGLQAGQVSESPFGPYTPDPAAVERAAPSIPPAAVAQPKKSGAGMIAVLAAVLVLLAGGGAYLAGVFDSGDTVTTTASQPDDETAVPESVPQEDGTKPGSEETDVAISEPVQPPVTEQPTEVKPQVADDLGKAATMISWVRDYPGGTCFHAAVTSGSDTEVNIEGFGLSAAPFERMLTEFQDVHGLEPEIGVRIIEEAQCAVTDFLNKAGRSSESRPGLELDKDLIKSKDTIRGEISGLGERNVSLLLIDNEGVVYNLQGLLRKSGEVSRFGFAPTLEVEKPVPQVIVAIASTAKLETAQPTGPILASNLFPQILAEMESKNIEASAAAKYFRLGGN